MPRIQKIKWTDSHGMEHIQTEGYEDDPHEPYDYCDDYKISPADLKYFMEDVNRIIKTLYKKNRELDKQMQEMDCAIEQLEGEMHLLNVEKQTRWECDQVYIDLQDK